MDPQGHWLFYHDLHWEEHPVPRRPVPYLHSGVRISVSVCCQSIDKRMLTSFPNLCMATTRRRSAPLLSGKKREMCPSLKAITEWCATPATKRECCCAVITVPFPFIRPVFSPPLPSGPMTCGCVPFAAITAASGIRRRYAIAAKKRDVMLSFRNDE